MPEALPFPAKSQQREKKSCREVTTVLSAKYSALSSTPAKSCAGLGALASRPPNVQLDSGEEDAHLLVARDYADRVPVGGSLDRLIYEVQASDRAEGLYVQGGHEGREVCELEGGRCRGTARPAGGSGCTPRTRSRPDSGWGRRPRDSRILVSIWGD